MTRRQFIALCGSVAGGVSAGLSQTLVGGGARFGALPHYRGLLGSNGSSRPNPVTWPLDDFEDLVPGAIFNGSNSSGWNFTGPYLGRTNYLGLMSVDDLEAYSVGGSVNGANGGTGWAGAFAERVGRFTSGPFAARVMAGETAKVVIAAAWGTSFQWKFNGSYLSNGGKYSGATTNTLTITNAQASEAGSYTCLVSDAGGSFESQPVTLDVRSGSLFYSDGSSLTPFTTSGTVTVDTSTGGQTSIKTNANAYAYANQSCGAGASLRFAGYAASNSLIDALVGCNSSGAGTLVRMEARSQYTNGVAPSTSWTAFGTFASAPSYSPSYAWNTIQIDIAADGKTLSWFLNGNIQQAKVPITVNGGYFSLYGDGAYGGNFDNIYVF